MTSTDPRQIDQNARLRQEPSSPWAPFRHASFNVMWSATVVANVGTWMYNAESGWLMTSLDPDPLIVSFVQVATTLRYSCSHCRPVHWQTSSTGDGFSSPSRSRQRRSPPYSPHSFGSMWSLR